jgi:hypothetical protein
MFSNRAAVLLAIISASVAADESWKEDSIALAQKYLSPGNSFIIWASESKQVRPRRSDTVKKAVCKFRKSGDTKSNTSFDCTVNGKGANTAHIYVRVADGSYRLLSALMGTVTEIVDPRDERQHILRSERIRKPKIEKPCDVNQPWLDRRDLQGAVLSLPTSLTLLAHHPSFEADDDFGVSWWTPNEALFLEQSMAYPQHDPATLRHLGPATEGEPTFHECGKSSMCIVQIVNRLRAPDPGYVYFKQSIGIPNKHFEACKDLALEIFKRNPLKL